MILSDRTLEAMIAEGSLVVDPLTENSIQPASVDCRLGTHFLVMDNTQNEVITMDRPVDYREINAESMIIAPHTFVLATTMEYVKLPTNMSAFVEGRSSIGRMGLFIQNAGWVDSGFEGRITLELYNATSLPIKLQAGRRICQLVFCKMDAPAKTPYKGKYQGQTVSVGSYVFKDNEVTNG